MDHTWERQCNCILLRIGFHIFLESLHFYVYFTDSQMVKHCENIK